MMYINNLGEFKSLADVWKEYPHGGKEGDYVTIDGSRVAWNKYTNTWGADSEVESEPSELKEFDGDVYVKGSLRVGGGITQDTEEEKVASVVLDTTTLVQGKMFYITPEQYNVIKKARIGVPVFIRDVNRTAEEREWGQVVSCLRDYTSPSSYIFRISVLHKGNPQGWVSSGEEHATIYNIDILDYKNSNGYSCFVTSINNLY
jgi:hypothetical protein